MCVGCLREAFPERERSTLERGSFMLNFAGCKQCGARDDFLVEQKRRREETEDETEQSFEETIEYEHCCKRCGHVVAQHMYEFRVVQLGTVQEFSMSCALCGKGEHTSSSVPTKPNPSSEDLQQVQDDLTARLAALDTTSKAALPLNLCVKAPPAAISAPLGKQEVDDDEWS